MVVDLESPKFVHDKMGVVGFLHYELILGNQTTWLNSQQWQNFIAMTLVTLIFAQKMKINIHPKKVKSLCRPQVLSILYTVQLKEQPGTLRWIHLNRLALFCIAI